MKKLIIILGMLMGLAQASAQDHSGPEHMKACNNLVKALDQEIDQTQSNYESFIPLINRLPENPDCKANPMIIAKMPPMMRTLFHKIRAKVYNKGGDVSAIQSAINQFEAKYKSQ